MASEKITNLVEEVKGLSVLELSELVKAIEEEFGVTAAAPVVVAGGAAAPAAEEKIQSVCGPFFGSLFLCFRLFQNVHHLQILQFQIVLLQYVNMLFQNVHH